MAKSVDREAMDHGQFPDAFEYIEVDPDSEVEVRTKDGFTLGSDKFYLGDNFRLIDNSGDLLIQKLSGGSWVDHFKYSTGSWTPRVYGTTSEGTGTYTAQYGKYTVIGNVCFINMVVTWTAHTGSGSMRIDGLPFPVASGSGNYGVLSVQPDNVSLTAGNIMTMYFQQASSYINIHQVPTGGGGRTAVTLDTAGQIFATGFYFIA